MTELESLRTELDAIDRELAVLFEKRMGVARRIADVKRREGLSVLDSSREEQVLSSRAALIGEEALREPARALWKELMRLSREEQQRWMEAQTSC